MENEIRTAPRFAMFPVSPRRYPHGTDPDSDPDENSGGKSHQRNNVCRSVPGPFDIGNGNDQISAQNQKRQFQHYPTDCLYHVPSAVIVPLIMPLLMLRRISVALTRRPGRIFGYLRPGEGQTNPAGRGRRNQGRNQTAFGRRAGTHAVETQGDKERDYATL